MQVRYLPELSCSRWCKPPAPHPSPRYAKTKVEGVPHPPAILSAYVDSLFRACHHDARVRPSFGSWGRIPAAPPRGREGEGPRRAVFAPAACLLNGIAWRGSV